MADLAQLVLEIKSDRAEVATRRLDTMAGASGRAQRATDQLAAANLKAEQAQRALIQAQMAGDTITSKMIRDAGGLEAATRAVTAALKQQEAATRAQAQAATASAVATRNTAALGRTIAASGASAKLAGYEMLNLSRQIADVGMMAALGQAPLLILIQQGPQIADVFQQARMRGIGFSAVLGQITAQVSRLLLRFAPLILAVGAVAAGFALLNRELQKGFPKDITDGLGLTEAQLKRVEDRTVHFGDVVMATFTVIGRHIMAGPVGDALRWLQDAFGKVLDWIVKATIGATAGMVGAYVGAFEAVRATWRMLPAVIGDLAISTANRVVSAVEAMINRAIDLINGLIGKANVAAKAAGLALEVPTLSGVSFGGIASPYAGAGAQAGQAAAEAFAKGFDRGAGIVIRGASRLAQEIGAETLARARKRALEEAGDPGKSRTARTPRDQTDERQSQIDTLIAQAKMEELQAQLALTREIEDRTKIEKQIALAQLAVKQAQVDRQIASIQQDVIDKRIGAEKGKELTEQLQGLKWLYAWTGSLQIKAIEEEKTAALAREAYALQASALESQADLLRAHADTAKSAYGRFVIGEQILKLEYQLERLKLEEVVHSTTATAAEKKIAEERLKVLEAIQAQRTATATDHLLEAFDSASQGLSGFASAFKSQNWSAMLRSLSSVIETIKVAFGPGGTIGGKIGAAAGIANIIGGAIGGTAGSALQGAAGGALAGMTFGPIGAAIGGVVGLIGGLFSGSAAKRQAREEAAQREAERLARIAAEARALELRILELSGQSVAALAAFRRDELEAMDPSNRAAQERVWKLEDEAEALAKANEIAAQRNDLLAQLAEIEGRTYEAEALRRATALRDLPEELHALQSMVWLRQDEAAAAQKAAEIERQRMSMEADLLDLLGRSSEALTIRRRMEIDALDASLRPWQEAIHKAQDFAAAMSRIAEVQSEAISLIDQQISASQTAADAARRAADAYRDAGQTLLDTIRDLRTGDLSTLAPGQRTALSRSALDQAFGQALGGDLKAFGALPGLAQGLLQSKMESAGSSLEYRREFARTTSLLQQASNAAGIHAGTMTYQEQLLDIQTGVLKEIKAELQKESPDAEVLKRQESLLSTISGLLQEQTGRLTTINSTLTDQTGQIIVGHSIVSAQTGQIVGITAASGQTVAQAVYQQTGQVVTGNVIMSAQTGAVEQGVALQDAVRAITAIDASYSAQMLQALAQQGGGNAPFGDLLTGNNKVVSILQQIRDLIAQQPVGDLAVPIVPNPPPPGGSQMSAWEQAKAAIIAGDPAALNRYLTVNPDIGARYANPTGNAGDFNRLAGESILAFAQRHAIYAISIGEAGPDNRGRNLYALGGAFTNGIVSRPTAFPMGMMGEAGPEAIMPLARGPGGRLGVYASNDNGDIIAEIRALRAEVAALRQPVEKTARSTDRMATFGIWAHGEDPNDPVETEAA